MMRVADWPTRLSDFLAEHMNCKMAWGKLDCALWAASWVLRATGVDFAKKWRGRYKTATGSKRVLRKEGYATLADAVTAALGEPIEFPLMGQRGDIALVQLKPQPGLGIVIGNQVALLCESGGLTYQPLRNALKVWRV